MVGIASEVLITSIRTYRTFFILNAVTTRVTEIEFCRFRRLEFSKFFAVRRNVNAFRRDTILLVDLRVLYIQPDFSYGFCPTSYYREYVHDTWPKNHVNVFDFCGPQFVTLSTSGFTKLG